MESIEEARAKREQANTLWARAVAEVRGRPKPYALMAAFVIAGPVITSYLFPEAPLGVQIVGGGAFGIYAALCAVPQKFL
jgi:hypothetical protein